MATLLNTDASLLPAGPATGFEFIGYDAVSMRVAIPGRPGVSPTMAGFDCSPLSCNNLASQYAVGRNCLIEDWDEVVRAATDFSREQPEPGPYVLLSVFRRLGESASPKPHTS